MMKQLVVCPLCHTRLRVNVKPAGSRRQRVKCAKCGSVIQFTVDQPAQSSVHDPSANDAAILEDPSAGKGSAYELEAMSDPEFAGTADMPDSADSDMPDDLKKAMSLSAGRDYHAAAPHPKKRRRPADESQQQPGRPLATPSTEGKRRRTVTATFELAGKKRFRLTPLRAVIAVLLVIFLIGLVFAAAQFVPLAGEEFFAIYLGIGLAMFFFACVVVWIAVTFSSTTLEMTVEPNGTVYATKTRQVFLIPVSTTEVDMKLYSQLESDKRINLNTEAGTISAILRGIFIVTMIFCCGLYFILMYLGWEMTAATMSDQGQSEDLFDVYLTGPTVETMYFCRDESALRAGKVAKQLSELLHLPIRGELARHTDPLWKF